MASGMSWGFWVMKKTPTPLERTRRTTCSIFSRRTWRHVVEEQVGLVEEEHEFGLGQVADLGEVLEEFGEHPQEEGGVDAWGASISFSAARRLMTPRPWPSVWRRSSRLRAGSRRSGRRPVVRGA
jgi:hypothetical protein